MNTLFEKLIRSLGIRHTKHFANTLYNEHPYKYTLYGISQMLSRYNIRNEALRLEDKNELAKLDSPFIAEVAHDIVIVKSINERRVIYDWYGEDIRMDFSKFQEISTGVVLLAYPNNESVESNYKEHHSQEVVENVEWGMIGIMVVIGMCAILCANVHSLDILTAIMGVGSILGGYISFLIIQKSLHIESKAADRLCSVFKKQSCNNVLETPAAKLFDRYGWGQIGLAYFLVNAFAIAIAPSFAATFMPLVSVCALPYPVWSIWYQKTKAKSWCSLCLVVQAILIFQVIIAVVMLFNSTWSLYDYVDLQIFIFPLAYLAVTLISHKISTIYSQAKEVGDWKAKLSLLKYRKEIIDKMFEGQKTHDISENASRIIFGKKDSAYRVTIFSNPYCNPCANMHKTLEELYEAGCQIQYVFTYFSKDLSKVNKYMMAAYEQYGMEHTWQLLTEWYDGGKGQMEKFFNEDLNINTAFVEEEFDHHEAWKKATGFNATPTILFNGKELPDSYNTKDLLFIINNGL